MLGRLLMFFSEWAQRSKTERALQQLDDRLLADIGFTRRRPLLLSNLEAAFLCRIEPNDAARRDMEAAALAGRQAGIAKPNTQPSNVVAEGPATAYHPGNPKADEGSLAA